MSFDPLIQSFIAMLKYSEIEYDHNKIDYIKYLGNIKDILGSAMRNHHRSV